MCPHYVRIMRQRAKGRRDTNYARDSRLEAMTKGCLGGQLFVSSQANGDVYHADISRRLPEISNRSLLDHMGESKEFNVLRDPGMLKENAVYASTDCVRRRRARAYGRYGRLP